MNAKEKAIELRDKFFVLTMNANLFDHGLMRSKECAIIAVDEILIVVTAIDGTEHFQKEYEEVKQELLKL